MVKGLSTVWLLVNTITLYNNGIGPIYYFEWNMNQTALNPDSKVKDYSPIIAKTKFATKLYLQSF